MKMVKENLFYGDNVEDFMVQMGIPDSGAATFYYLPQTYVKITYVAGKLITTCYRVVSNDSYPEECNCSNCSASQFAITSFVGA